MKKIVYIGLCILELIMSELINGMTYFFRFKRNKFNEEIYKSHFEFRNVIISRSGEYYYMNLPISFEHFTNCVGKKIIGDCFQCELFEFIKKNIVKGSKSTERKNVFIKYTNTLKAGERVNEERRGGMLIIKDDFHPEWTKLWYELTSTQQIEEYTLFFKIPIKIDPNKKFRFEASKITFDSKFRVVNLEINEEYYIKKIQKSWRTKKSNRDLRKFQDLIVQISHYPTLDPNDKRGYQTKKIFNSRWD